MMTATEIDAAAIDTLRRGFEALRAIACKADEVEREYGATSPLHMRVVRAASALLDDLEALAEAEDIDRTMFEALFQATGRRMS